MKKTHSELGRAFVFAGLTAALALGIIGSCCYRRHPGAITTTSPRQISRIEMLDAQARPHIDEARRNIPSVVDELTGTGALCRLCWFMSRDKVTGSHKTQVYLESMLNGPIVGPCRAGAKAYGCDITAAGFVNGVRAVNSDYALTGAQYAFAECCFSGRGVPAHREEALCCFSGRGVPANREEALKWYRKAAEQGHAEAQYNLGLCYSNGSGVSANKTLAAEWFRKAAKQGHAEAQSHLNDADTGDW